MTDVFESKSKEELILNSYRQNGEVQVRIAEDLKKNLLELRAQYLATLTTIITASATVLGLLAAFQHNYILERPLIGLSFILMVLSMLLALWDVYSKTNEDVRSMQSEAWRADALFSELRRIETEFLSESDEEKREQKFQKWGQTNQGELAEVQNSQTDRKIYNPIGFRGKLIYWLFIIGMSLIASSLLDWDRISNYLPEFFSCS